ncbi:hypothetical protein AX17_003482 [Amanita inopinata Kibby_2008]|nr:hypothetical protein AX17_003482 [Amanita inopinata Kibby_2008]
MSTQTGRKRAAAPASHHAQKKTRILEPADDPANFADQVDEALELPSRRGKVKTEGYESDSSDDGEGVVFSRKEKENLGGEGEDDDDMFAAVEKVDKDGSQPDDTTKSKKAQYLRLGDIEGQEFGALGSGQENASDDSDEPEDEDDAERRKKAGMGYELSSFNMREEMEEGKFTEDGTYVKTYDPHGVHDRWMDGVSEQEIKMARKRKRQQEKLQKEKMEAEEKELRESGGKGSLEKELLAMLKKGETVLEALQRLGAQAKKSHKNLSLKQHTADSDIMNVDKPFKALSDIEQLTHLASTIMSLGETDIYSMTYEELVRGVRSSGAVSPSWEPPSADVKYEYKWDVPGVDQNAENFGPFSEEEMKAWFKASYFGASGEKVKVRRVGGEWGGWDDVIL